MECKVECNQDKEPEYALKHACVPTATCGSKLPTAKFRMWPWDEKFLRWRCLRLSAGVLRIRAPKGMVFYGKRSQPAQKGSQKGPKWSQKGAKSDQSGAKREPKRAKGTYKGPPAEKYRKIVPPSLAFGLHFGSIFGKNPLKTPSKKSFKF